MKLRPGILSLHVLGVSSPETPQCSQEQGKVNHGDGNQSCALSFAWGHPCPVVWEKVRRRTFEFWSSNSSLGPKATLSPTSESESLPYPGAAADSPSPQWGRGKFTDACPHTKANSRPLKTVLDTFRDRLAERGKPLPVGLFFGVPRPLRVFPCASLSI